jgi:hypothetical protein
MFEKIGYWFAIIFVTAITILYLSFLVKWAIDLGLLENL